MTSYELINEIKQFREAFPPKGALLKATDTGAQLFDKLALSMELSSFSRLRRQIRASLEAMFTVKQETLKDRQIDSNPRQVLRDAVELLKQIRSRQLFAEIEYAEQNVLSKTNLVNRQIDDNNTFTMKFAEFVSAYEKFIESYELPATLAFLKAAKALEAALEARFEVFDQIEAAIVNTASVDINSQGKAIELFLHSPTRHLSRVVSKLTALTIIYSELCRLINVSESANPLIVTKVETGSLWVKLFGEPQVTKLMADLIRSGVQFLYRNYTNEGKLNSVPSKIDVVETNILLEQRMRALGYDTTTMREDIQKAGAVISKQTNMLLEGEAVLLLNGEKFSVGAELEKQYLEQSKTLLLTDAADEEALKDS
jgi:hypothetical protein